MKTWWTEINNMSKRNQFIYFNFLLGSREICIAHLWSVHPPRIHGLKRWSARTKRSGPIRRSLTPMSVWMSYSYTVGVLRISEKITFLKIGCCESVYNRTGYCRVYWNRRKYFLKTLRISWCIRNKLSVFAMEFLIRIDESIGHLFLVLVRSWTKRFWSVNPYSVRSVRAQTCSWKAWFYPRTC